MAIHSLQVQSSLTISSFDLQEKTCTFLKLNWNNKKRANKFDLMLDLVNKCTTQITRWLSNTALCIGGGGNICVILKMINAKKSSKECILEVQWNFFIIE